MSSQGRIQLFVKGGGSKLVHDRGGTTEYTHLDKLQLIWIQQFQIYFSIRSSSFFLSFFLSSFFPFFKGGSNPWNPPLDLPMLLYMRSS